MRRALVLLAAVAVALAAATAAAAAPERVERADGETIKVYFLLGEQLLAVERPGATVQDAMRALLAGPSAEESANGVNSSIPGGTPLRSTSVVDGIARVDFGERITIGTNAEELSSRLAQVVATAASISGVRRVQVLVKGGLPLGLFPGFNAAKPLSLPDVQRPNVPPPVSPGQEPGTPTDSTRVLQQRLADLGYLAPDGVDGIDGPATRFAVEAFQKWEGLARDGIAGPQTQARLATASRPTPIQAGTGRRIEVLLDRQLVLLIDRDAVVRTIPVSSGKAGYATPPGSFRVYSKQERSWSVPYKVWLPWASYFNGGIAFHEYPDVPTEPASHGCVRIPSADARYLYEQAPVGTPVVVISSSR
jgi:lipoprotein-anchoring transpeptidase ErfK/SrfK